MATAYGVERRCNGVPREFLTTPIVHRRQTVTTAIEIVRNRLATVVTLAAYTMFD